jgi:hypothetical protein
MHGENSAVLPFSSVAVAVKVVSEAGPGLNIRNRPGTDLCSVAQDRVGAHRRATLSEIDVSCKKRTS